MHRVLAGGIAIFAGLVVGAGVIWLWIGGSNQPDALGWTAMVGLFVLPALAIPMALGLLLLEGAASWLKRPRVHVLLLGPILIPLFFLLLLGGPYLLMAPFNPESAGLLTVAIAAAAAIAPCFVVSLIYVLLTRNSVDRA